MKIIIDTVTYAKMTSYWRRVDLLSVYDWCPNKKLNLDQTQREGYRIREAEIEMLQLQARRHQIVDKSPEARKR